MENAITRIVQLSDCHLFGDSQKRLLGVNTQESLDLIVKMIQQEDFTPDMLILTGDLSQDCSKKSYENLIHSLSGFSCPIYWITGNHDDLQVMQHVFANSILSPAKSIVTSQGWQFILLNTLEPGKVSGRLNKQELKHLADSLAKEDYKYAMIFLHHHPVKVGSQWLDPIGLQNADEFFAVLAPYTDRLRAIAWGHIHQVYEAAMPMHKYYSAPSTCIQFLPHSEKFILDTQAGPGYRCFELLADGKINSWVRRLEDYKPPYDVNATGY